MAELTRLHTSDAHVVGPVVVVHAQRDDRPIGPDNPAHAFGPFASIEDAEHFEGEDPDGCYRFVLEIVGPERLGRRRLS